VRRPARRARALAPALLAALVPLALLAARPLAGVQEEPEVKVIVDNPRPAADDVVRLTYVFTGPGAGGSLRAPAQLPLKNLVVVGGPNSSTHFNFVNRHTNSTSSLT